MKVHIYDLVKLKNGKIGVIVDILGENEVFTVDIGENPSNYDTITVKINDIAEVITD